MRSSDWSSDVCSSDLRCGNDGLEFRDTFGAANEKRQDFAERVNIDQRRRLATGHSLGRGIAWGQTQGSQRRTGVGPVLPQGRYRPGDTEINELGDPVTGHQNVGRGNVAVNNQIRSEEHTSELQSLMRISYAVFC